MVCSANQIARLRTTPTTAAVIVESAALTALLSRRTSTNGAPRKIQRKHGMKVTQVASNPPSVPASIGESAAWIAISRHEAHELQDHDQRTACGLTSPMRGGVLASMRCLRASRLLRLQEKTF